MKKLIAFMLALTTTLSICAVSAFAEEVDIDEETQEENVEEIQETENIDPHASLYFSSYAYDLEPSSKKGYLDFSASVVTTGEPDKVRVSVQIQQYNDGWEDYTGEYIGTSSRTSYIFEDTVKVDRGEEYRAKIYYEAIVNNKVVETKIFATGPVLAP